MTPHERAQPTNHPTSGVDLAPVHGNDPGFSSGRESPNLATMSDRPTSMDGGRKAVRPGTVLRWLAMAVSLFFVARLMRSGGADVGRTLRELSDGRGRHVAAGLVLEIAWMWSLAQVYRTSLMALGGRAGNGEALRVSMGAFALSRILPGGGAAGSVFAARELMALGNPAAVTITSMLISWWLSMLTLSGVVFAGTAVAHAAGALTGGYTLAAGVVTAVLLALGAGAVWAVGHPRARSRLAELSERWSAQFGLAGSSLGSTLETVVAGRGRPLVKVSLWAAAGWTFDAATLWIMFAAFGHRLGLGALLVGYGLANLIQALPELTPGWLGVLEASLAVTYTAFGVPPAVAVLAVLGYRLLSYWLPVAAGFPLALQMLRRPRIAPERSRS